MALLIEDSVTERILLTSLTRREGLNVVQATDADSALAAIESQAPDLILLDMYLPGQDGMALLGRIREEHPFVPVIVVSSRDECGNVEKALNLGAVNFLRRPIRPEEFRTVLDRIASALEEEDGAHEDLVAAVDRRTTLSIPGDPSILPRVIAYLGREVRTHYPRLRVPLPDIKLALYEALANAVEHGTLEIGYDHKGEALHRPKGMRRLVAERLTSAPYAERRIHIRSEYRPRQVVYRIRDEGGGFDPARFDVTAALADTERLHGRGLALIRHYMDEVTWNDDGREIQMSRRLDAPTPTARPIPEDVTPE